jgi:LacI family transcriptional regulator
MRRKGVIRLKSVSEIGFMQKPGIHEVARHAGVSAATVSRVLNGTALVRAERRERVLHALAELNYRPNHVARNLRRQRTRMIGVLVSDIENPHFSGLVRAIEQRAYEEGYRLLLCNTDERADKQANYLRVLAAERVAGVILSTTDPDASEISELFDLGIPVVAIDRSVTDPRADAVLVDNAAATRRATEHVIAGGHTRIGFVGGPTEIETAAARRAGYRQAIDAAGLVRHEAEDSFRIEGGRAATEHLLGTDSELTALITANNLITIGALEVLRAHALRIPQQIAVVAVDDPFWAEVVEPPLTALAQPVWAIAESAFSFLIERIEHAREQPRQLMLDFELRVRGSCGRRMPSASAARSGKGGGQASPS